VKKLDRYIIKRFLGTFFFILGLIMLLAVVFDVSERIEDFIKTQPPTSAILFDYYLNFIFFYSNVFSALIIFIAVIFFTSKMAQNSEIIAILSSGVSFPRFLRPYIIAATVLTGLSLYTNHFVLPKANKKMIEFEARYVWNKPTYSNIHREMRPGLFAYIYSYSDGKVENMWLEKWEDQELKSVFYATRGTTDSLSNNWKFENYFERVFHENKETIHQGAKKDTLLPFNIKDFGQRMEYAITMTSPELSEYIKEEKDKGNENIIQYEIELHQRTSYPVATYILTIIATCVACRKKRGGLGVNIAIGLLVAVFYIFCMKMTSVAATNAGLSPFISVWIPNVLFGIIAIFFYRWARQ
jgi:lipopolysaccharide export system permease protein